MTVWSWPAASRASRLRPERAVVLQHAEGGGLEPAAELEERLEDPREEDDQPEQLHVRKDDRCHDGGADRVRQRVARQDARRVPVVVEEREERARHAQRDHRAGGAALHGGEDTDAGERDRAHPGLEPVLSGEHVGRVHHAGDGDRDVVLADTSDRFRLYENRETGGNWLQVRVRGDPAVGSVVRVRTSRETITRVQSSRSNFFSQSTRTLQFGLGPATVDSVRITRPDGTEHTIENVEVDSRLVVAENGSVRTVPTGESGC